MNDVPIAIIGGSGLCRQDVFLTLDQVRPETEFGLPSDAISICEFTNVTGEPGRVAFLPRHDDAHSLAPHAVPYRANIAALQSLGVRQIVATCIAGSLRRAIRPGDLVVPDQFVNLTWGRDQHRAAPPVHLPFADPYCPTLRQLFIFQARQMKVRTHARGTVAVIQGPRFSSRAESRWFARQGWSLVNMTQYPECYYARESGMCYASLAMITDYDVGVSRVRRGLRSDKSFADILPVFHRNVVTLKLLLHDLIPSILKTTCQCTTPFPSEYYKQV
ncbi:MAG: MTAP family purine nucleoside phosphorylase [Pseudonocardiaceae bacterium]